MDTPLEVCLDRVRQRRIEKGNTKPFNTANTEGAYYAVINSADKFKEIGVITRLINHKLDPVAQIKAILDEDDGFRFENSYIEKSFMGVR
jgi:hypothetical protein